MLHRRSLIRSLLAALLAGALPRPARAGPPRLADGFHVVDGWILTTADLQHLAAHAR